MLMCMLTGEGINSDKKGDAMVVRHFPFAAANARSRDPVNYRVLTISPLCNLTCWRANFISMELHNTLVFPKRAGYTKNLPRKQGRKLRNDMLVDTHLTSQRYAIGIPILTSPRRASVLSYGTCGRLHEGGRIT